MRLKTKLFCYGAHARIQGCHTSYKNDENLNIILFDCATKALSSILGESSVSTLVFAVQERFGLPGEELRRKPLVMVSGLVSFLGETGYRMLEPAIINEIRARFNIQDDVNELNFEEVAELAAKKHLGNAP